MKFKAASTPDGKKSFRLLVCGSRTFADRDLLFAKLGALTRKIKRPLIVVHGGARGRPAGRPVGL